MQYEMYCSNLVQKVHEGTENKTIPYPKKWGTFPPVCRGLRRCLAVLVHRFVECFMVVTDIVSITDYDCLHYSLP